MTPGGGTLSKQQLGALMQTLERFAERVAYWTGICVIALVAAFTLLVFVSVVLRYGLSRGLDWSEEAGRYLMIWMGFLAASLALRSGAHVGVDLVRAVLPRPVRRVVVLAGTVAVAAFFVMVVYQGIRLLAMVWPQESLALRISMFWPYLAIPVGSLLMLIQMIPFALREWKAGTGARETQGEPVPLGLE